jgi:acetyltransferase-like isoleucine patch superfamily enzyme
VETENDEVKEYLQNKSLAKITSEGSMLYRYQDVVVGNKSLLRLIYFEFCVWLSKVPGAAGLFLRKIFWPRLFGSCGNSVFFGENITLRHPSRIYLGNRVVISDGCILDARSSDFEKVIDIDDDVIFSNNVSIICKGGNFHIGSHSGVGANTIIATSKDNPVEIGTDVFIAPQCFLTGGANYNMDKVDVPIWKQGLKKEGGTKLGNDIWLGAKVTILGGVSIGSHSIIAAGAVVNKSLNEKSVSVGIPAKTIKYR